MSLSQNDTDMLRGNVRSDVQQLSLHTIEAYPSAIHMIETALKHKPNTMIPMLFHESLQTSYERLCRRMDSGFGPDRTPEENAEARSVLVSAMLEEQGRLQAEFNQRLNDLNEWVRVEPSKAVKDDYSIVSDGDISALGMDDVIFPNLDAADYHLSDDESPEGSRLATPIDIDESSTSSAGIEIIPEPPKAATPIDIDDASTVTVLRAASPMTFFADEKPHATPEGLPQPDAKTASPLAAHEPLKAATPPPEPAAAAPENNVPEEAEQSEVAPHHKAAAGGVLAAVALAASPNPAALLPIAAHAMKAAQQPAPPTAAQKAEAERAMMQQFARMRFGFPM